MRDYVSLHLKIAKGAKILFYYYFFFFFFSLSPYTRFWGLIIFAQNTPRKTQNQEFTLLSKATSIPVCFKCLPPNPHNTTKI